MRPICFATKPWKRLNAPLGAGREIRLRYLPREGCSCSETNVHDPDGVTWRHRDDRVVRGRLSDHVPSAHLVRLWIWACSFASNIITSMIAKMKAVITDVRVVTSATARTLSKSSQVHVVIVIRFVCEGSASS